MSECYIFTTRCGYIGYSSKLTHLIVTGYYIDVMRSVGLSNSLPPNRLFFIDNSLSYNRLFYVDNSLN